MEEIVAVKLEKCDFRNITGLIEDHLRELEKQRNYYRKKYSEMMIFSTLIKNWEKVLTAIRKEL